MQKFLANKGFVYFIVAGIVIAAIILFNSKKAATVPIVPVDEPLRFTDPPKVAVKAITPSDPGVSAPADTFVKDDLDAYNKMRYYLGAAKIPLDDNVNRAYGARIHSVSGRNSKALTLWNELVSAGLLVVINPAALKSMKGQLDLFTAKYPG